ncbi:MAG TPA: VWA domain-containing protein, partial [Pirellulales bacterium]|nr:VWA domain-containing protein [Pirellulales bacterium]
MMKPRRSHRLLLQLIAPARWLFASRCRADLPVNVAYRAASLSLTWRLGLRWLVPAFRVLGLIALVLAATGPSDWQSAQWVDSQGIAIELVVDRSGSMLADDYTLDGRRVSRLDAVRAAAGRFIVGDTEPRSRSADSIGLVTFAAEPEVACPLTIDQEAVVAQLERTGAAADYREDGTAIGDAWALAVAELRALEQSLQSADAQRTLTKVAVLLTDGEHNAGRLTPGQAAELARRFGVRTYVIGLEPRDLGSETARQRVAAERDHLRSLSAATGGQLYTVSDMRSLRNVYAEIDALERTKIAQQRLITRRHWAVDYFEIGPFAVPPLALIALALLALE